MTTDTYTGVMTPDTPTSSWLSGKEASDSPNSHGHQQALGSPVPLHLSSETPHLEKGSVQSAFNLSDLELKAKNARHAKLLRARLQLAYFRVKTDQIGVPLNEIAIK